MNPSITQFIHDACLFGLFLMMILFSKMINDLLTPYSVDEEVTQKDNDALSISLCGYLMATSIIFIGAMLGPSTDLATDLVSVGGYTLLGVMLLNLSRVINDKLILRKFCNINSIIEERNLGTGVVQFGSYLASGMIVAGSVNGQGGGFITLFAFYALGQIMLVIFTAIYNLVTPFNLHDEIEKKNTAAGIALGGSLVALGILLLGAVGGDFISWKDNLTRFGMHCSLFIVLIPSVRYFFDKLIIPKASLNEEIARDQNIGAAILEVGIAISVASMLVFTMK